MSTMDVANRLVELCNAGEWNKAIEETHADDVVSVEAVAMGPEGRETKGKANVLKRGEAWDNAHEIHGFKIEGPFPHDDKFICMMEIDVTAKEGPIAGQRMLMKEACHYTVTDGKVSRVEFYYAM